MRLTGKPISFMKKVLLGRVNEKQSNEGVSYINSDSTQKVTLKFI